ncbi:hypothetical protein ACILFL_11535 [Capnocytophaga canis]
MIIGLIGVDGLDIITQNKHKISILNNEEILKKMRNKVLLVLVFLLVVSCGIFKKKYTPDRQNVRFMNYLKSRGIDPDTVKVFSRYYRDSYNYQKEQERQALLKNPYVKLNEAYTSYRNGNIYFYVFLDNGRVFRQEHSLQSDYFSVTDDNLVKIKRPIYTSLYCIFKLEENKLLFQTWQRVPYNEWDEVVIFSIKNDTLIGQERYKSKGYKKQKIAKVHKLENKILIHRPELKIEEAEILGLDVKFLAITGEFQLK